MNLLHDRSRSIDVQIRKHQTRLHNIESKRLQHGTDEKLLEELVSLFFLKKMKKEDYFLY